MSVIDIIYFLIWICLLITAISLVVGIVKVKAKKSEADESLNKSLNFAIIIRVFLIVLIVFGLILVLKEIFVG